MNKRDLKFKTEGRAKTVKYVTKERLDKVNPDNLKVYNQYLRTSIMKNKDVAKTTYKVYKSNFNSFLCYIMENWDNFYLLDGEFVEDNMLDVMEGYMAFLQDELGNNKKTINNKIAAVSSFYLWASKRRKIRSHPFGNGELDRMKGASDEKVIAEYFLHKDEVKQIVGELSLVDEGIVDYDKQDQLLWHIAYDSACRIGALYGLKISNLDMDANRFRNIREKRGKIVSVPFTPHTKQLIAEFLEQREILSIDCDEFFYAKTDGHWHGMSKQSISRRIKKIGYIIGIGDFRPHCIRKTRLNEVAKYDINKAKALANHESLDTTSRFYTEKEDQADVLESIMKLEEEDEG